MDYDKMLDKIKKIPFDKQIDILSDNEFTVFVFRPSVLSKRFNGKYDVKKNFQIWLEENGTERKFRPNHLRVMLDLNLRIRCRPDLKKKLCLAFDNIYYGKDPLDEIKNLKEEKFDFYLNGLEIIAVLSQLFIIEQDYAYPRESKYDPATLFYQGWIRQMLTSTKEIDNLCMSVCNRQPPNQEYTYKENKKHKKYDANAKPLWYLEEK